MTTTPGAAMGAVIVLALQEAIVIGLTALGQNERAIDELVGRSDTLTGNSADPWRESLKTVLRDMVNPASPNFCEVIPAYPSPPGQARLPVISLIEQSGGENAAEAVIGNVLRESTAFFGPNQELYLTQEIGSGHQTVVQAGVWCPQPERALLIQAALQWALYHQQARLLERGIHEISFRTGSVEVDQNLEPRVAVCPMVIVTASWTFRESTRRKVPNRVTILPAKPANP